MNLVVDIGNTLGKAAIFEGNSLIRIFQFKSDDVARLGEISRSYSNLKYAILSSVADVALTSQIQQALEETIDEVLLLKHTTPLPIGNLYDSKQTLGLDRLAAAVGANDLFPGRNVLVIDAGTAITLDVVDAKGQFLGGNISPGIETRFKALHEFTGRLPKGSKTDQWHAIGKTTEEAICAGVLNGVIWELDGMINSMQNRFADLITVVTGGDAAFFDKKLKNTIFVKFEITLVGLNRILEYNVENN